MKKLLILMTIILIASMTVAHGKVNQGLREGMRVKVSASAPWAIGAMGTITLPPSNINEYVSDWNTLRRILPTPKGEKVSYWVQLDHPMKDSDGDGPFIGGEFDQSYLEESGEKSDPGVLTKRTGKLQLIWFENKALGLKVEFKAKVLSRSDSK